MAARPGVTQCLDIIRRELDMTMALCGQRDILDIDRSILRAPPLSNHPGW